MNIQNKDYTVHHSRRDEDPSFPNWLAGNDLRRNGRVNKSDRTGPVMPAHPSHPKKEHRLVPLIILINLPVVPLVRFLRAGPRHGRNEGSFLCELVSLISGLLSDPCIILGWKWQVWRDEGNEEKFLSGLSQPVEPSMTGKFNSGFKFNKNIGLHLVPRINARGFLWQLPRLMFEICAILG